MVPLENLQGIVARNSSRELFSILFFRIDSAKGASAFVRRWMELTPKGQDVHLDATAELYFLFGWSGLAKILSLHREMDPQVGRSQLEIFFTDPAQAPDRPAIAGDLGFVGRSSPDQWWEGKFKSSDIELGVYCCFSSEEQQKMALNDLRLSASDLGLHELTLESFPAGALSGYRPPKDVLHFGFRDGISRQHIDWSDEKTPGSVNLRQVVIGYPSPDFPTMPQRPGPWLDFAKDSSFAGVMWISQDVAEFNRYLRTNAPRVIASGAAETQSDAEEWLAAKLMGRWRNGSALARYPLAQPQNADIADDFIYGDDLSGLKCPLTAHIRVVNSRDQGLNERNRTRFPDGSVPRLQRRGFTFGSKLEGIEDDGKDRGIVGTFLCARVNEQFYTVLRWMQETEFSEVFSEIPGGLRAQDSVIGNRSRPRANKKAFIPLAGDTTLDFDLSDFTRIRGVKVFFVPSVHALEVISSSEQ